MKKYFRISYLNSSCQILLIGALALTIPSQTFAENMPKGAGTETDPIVILHKNQEEAVEAQFTVLRSIMRRESLLQELQNQKLLWRVLIAEPIDNELGTITELMIDTMVIGATNTESEVKNIYFDSSASGTHLQKEFVAYHHNGSGISFPNQLGWLHFKSSHDYEPKNPGLGQSVSYNAPSLTATFYLYDLGIRQFPESVEHPEVRALFDKNIREVLSANAGATQIGAPENLGNFLVQKFELDGEESILGLTVCPDRFAKFRATSSNKVELRKAMFNSLMAFMSLARDSECAKGVWMPQ